MEAFVKAREQGKIRWIGFTGHKDPAVHAYMLEVAERHGFRFDTVQMPLNPFDAHFRSFERKVLPKLVAHGIGVLGMKSMGSGVLLQSKTLTAVECLRYALHLPTSVVITGIDSEEVLQQAIQVAAMEALADGEAEELRQRTLAAAKGGQYELFKTSSVFDSTAKNPKWLGEETEEVLTLAEA